MSVLAQEMLKKLRLSGSIRLNGDKSVSHRALIFSALADGRSRIRNLSRGADVASTRKIYGQLGTEYTGIGDELIVTGRGLHNFRSDVDGLDCGNSGTTLRLSMGVLAGSKITCRLFGDDSLNRRPVMRVIRPLRSMGADIRTAGDVDNPPVEINGTSLSGADYRSPVASAQVKSAVLLAGLYARGDTVFSEPSRSRDHTERLLKIQGIDIGVSDSKILLSPGKEPIPFEYDVPGDISTAVNFIVAALVMSNSDVRLERSLLNETRTGALDILRDMAGSINTENESEINGEPVGDVVVKASSLHGVDTIPYAAARFIDEIPILAVAASFASGRTVFRDVGELRIKESDRLGGIVEILSCFGCNAAVVGDDLIVEGGVGARQKDPDIRGDHRLAMAVEILNMATGGGLSGEYAECIGISAPEFYESMRGLSS
jgi:3-phosphoshikimate 1-carboxyvinyltransferase